MKSLLTEWCLMAIPKKSRKTSSKIISLSKRRLVSHSPPTPQQVEAFVALEKSRLVKMGVHPNRAGDLANTIGKNILKKKKKGKIRGFE
ncbi:MAG: hypothetical protein NTY48_04680 [Candidatus Diapherotrites archaeon]|nr:hypothetical protein [Candidatus Diapherotrites archaeon]